MQHHILQCVRDLCHWNTDKIILWGKQYYWKLSPKIASQVYPKCQVCPKHKPGRPSHTSTGHFPLPSVPFEVWQMDFIHWLPSQGYRYVLVMIWGEAFHRHRATASAVGTIFVDKIFPTWRIPSELHRDQGTHFTGRIIQSVCKSLSILQHFHCAYHPLSSRLVERTGV